MRGAVGEPVHYATLFSYKKMRPLLLAALLACLAALATAAAAPRGTLLALLADPADRAGRFGPFFDGLEAGGWALDVQSSAKAAADAPLALKAWDTWVYDGVVVLPGKTNGKRERDGGGGAAADRKAPIQKPILVTFLLLFSASVCCCMLRGAQATLIARPV